ncbi:MAG: response regulator [Gammaproteobacteria bacterium]|nr:response regulator [Gammaproteobacteria bacterium]
MSTDKPQLLIVDDSTTDLIILKEMLGNDYAYSEANNGRDAVALCEAGKSNPLVVLLDVNMPELNGYETCMQLKACSGFEHVEVIFISANHSFEEKQRGYEVGGSDFLVKPVNPEELRQKVRLAIERSAVREEYETQTKYAMDAAMTAIMDAGEQVNVVHFLRDSFQCKTMDELAHAIVNATSNFGLSSTVQIRTPSKVITVSSNGTCPPLEIEMLTSLKEIGRIHQRGKRLILNFNDISQLVKNLPEEDENKCGRYRDHLALILDGAKSRADGLLVIEQMKHLLEKTEKSIGSIRDYQQSQKGRNVRIMDSMLEEMHAGLFDYGLTEEQETVLLKMVENYSDKVFKAYEDGLKLDENLEDVSETLKRSISKFFNRNYHQVTNS